MNITGTTIEMPSTSLLTVTEFDNEIGDNTTIQSLITIASKMSVMHNTYLRITLMWSCMRNWLPEFGPIVTTMKRAGGTTYIMTIFTATMTGIAIIRVDWRSIRVSRKEKLDKIKHIEA